MSNLAINKNLVCAVAECFERNDWESRLDVELIKNDPAVSSIWEAMNERDFQVHFTRNRFIKIAGKFWHYTDALKTFLFVHKTEYQRSMSNGVPNVWISPEASKAQEAKVIQKLNQMDLTSTSYVKAKSKKAPVTKQGPSKSLEPIQADVISYLKSPASFDATNSNAGRQTLSAHGDDFKESALLGFDENQQDIYLNIYEPFCAVAVGVPGTGKSHTLATILESCFIPLESPTDKIITLKHKMSALLLHYDSSSKSLCEAVGLQRCKPFQDSAGIQTPEIVVFVSPTNKTRQKEYERRGYRTLRFYLDWSKLKADHLKRIMRLKNKDNQLYVATMLMILRGYDDDHMPSLNDFIRDVESKCNKLQSQSFTQRMDILKSFISKDPIKQKPFTIETICKPGTLVIVDLSDKFLSADDINGIFEVLVDMYRCCNDLPAKVLVLDEAHKYMSENASDELGEAIADVVRNMRHDGMRLIVGTQNPRVLHPEILELVSLVFMHRFHSRDWFQYLSQKLAIPANLSEDIMKLNTGEAYAFAPNFETSTFKIKIRQRITEDLGASVTNYGGEEEPLK